LPLTPERRLSLEDLHFVLLYSLLVLLGMIMILRVLLNFKEVLVSALNYARGEGLRK
jgi:hypothetical protein